MAAAGGIDHEAGTVAGVLIAVAGLAVIAVLVSSGSNTGGVLGSLGSSISQLICVATSPITGTSCGSLTANVSHTITF